ncbi:MAG: hypothetical protein H6815_05620 [Phycisphaeraceae bacterium]|nr:hypothetical protein [Phycisphaerales bacterium]MCB9859916.1 hypothetical protein [Phycisphaeraceae bacterium]
MHVSFVIPAYNEEQYIADTIGEIRTAAKAVGVDHEIIGLLFRLALRGTKGVRSRD